MSEVDKAEQVVMGSGMAADNVRNLYFILHPNTPGECAPVISIIGADTTVILKEG